MIVKGKPGTSQIESSLSEGWLKEERVKIDFDYSSEGIEKTDAELICLAETHRIPLLSNDQALMRCAKAHGVETRWLTLSLLDVIKKEVLSKKESESVLMELVNVGLRIRSDVFVRVLELVKRV